MKAGRNRVLNLITEFYAMYVTGCRCYVSNISALLHGLIHA